MSTGGIRVCEIENIVILSNPVRSNG